jgi:RNA 3'-terminal phosphate cyclase (ATP)
MERAGFYPAGGGRLVIGITPVSALQRIAVPERGRIREKRGRVLLSNLPAHIAERELEVLRKKLQISHACLTIETPESVGPGNAVIVEVDSTHVTEVFTAFGRVRVPAENVAGEVVREVRHYLDGEAPVGPHLADQLLVPMALAAGGSFVTGPLSDHTRTNIEIVKMFLDVVISVDSAPNGCTAVTISDRA